MRMRRFLTSLTPRFLAKRPLIFLILVVLIERTAGLASRADDQVRYRDFVVQGQRARLYLRHSQSSHTTTSFNQEKDCNTRPLVVLPGMAQTIQVWDAQATLLSKNRPVLVCEPLGVGKPGDNTNTNTKNVTLPYQAQQLYQTIEHVLQQSNREEPSTNKQPLSVDMAGFSLGGRIVMAFACLYPRQVHHLHLTGVAWERSPRGEMHVLAWKDCLEKDNLLGFTWLAVMASYSPAYLLARQSQVLNWIAFLTNSHTTDGLLRIMQQTHTSCRHKDSSSTAWTVPEMVQRLPQKSQGKLVVGELDDMVSVEQVERLAQELGGGWDVTVIPQAGHAVPMEEPRLWREHVLSTLQ